MTLNGWIGHWQTWGLIVIAWIGLGVVFGLLYGVIARIGRE